jgi:hypothetical protein
MSTTALLILELAKTLPVEEQRFICAALGRHAGAPGSGEGSRFIRTPDGECHNPSGLPNDDPFFRLLEEIETARHATSGRPLPELA